MTRTLSLALLLTALAAPAAAQTPKLQYRVQTGGLLAGVFTAIEIPAIGISVVGSDIQMVALSGPKDGRKVVLTGGTVKDYTYKTLQPMVGQQMSVKIAVVPLDTAPGKRCKVVLDHAKLEKLTPDSITFQPSETPEFECD